MFQTLKEVASESFAWLLWIVGSEGRLCFDSIQAQISRKQPLPSLPPWRAPSGDSLCFVPCTAGHVHDVIEGHPILTPFWTNCSPLISQHNHGCANAGSSAPDLPPCEAPRMRCQLLVNSSEPHKVVALPSACVCFKVAVSDPPPPPLKIKTWSDNWIHMYMNETHYSVHVCSVVENTCSNMSRQDKVSSSLWHFLQMYQLLIYLSERNLINRLKVTVEFDREYTSVHLLHGSAAGAQRTLVHSLTHSVAHSTFC